MSCFSYFKLVFIIVHLSFYMLNAESGKVRIRRKIKTQQILPLEQDLRVYLKYVETVSNYCVENKKDIDVNYMFGLFLANVNLIRAIKHRNIPADLKTELKELVDRHEKAMNHFHKETRNDMNHFNYENRMVSTLCSNASFWEERLEKFVYTEGPSYTSKELLEIYSEWEIYTHYINNWNSWLPSPRESDFCLFSLALNPVNTKKSTTLCPTSKNCYKNLKEGSNFGYALYHRLLLILMAHLGRRCVIFTYEEDKAFMKSYCKLGYSEAQYIAMNNYRTSDMMLEIISLCALDGNSQFLNRVWLNELLRLQNGCYGEQYILPNIRSVDSWTEKNRYKYQNILKAKCNGHTAGVGLGAFSAAIRFIIENNY